MIANIDKLLSPDCRFFEQKMFVICLCEHWSQWEPTWATRLLEQCCQEFKESHEKKYYLTIYHLLTCPFCLERSPILQKYSHPDLWKLSCQSEDLQWADIANRAQQDTPLYYLQLLHTKLGDHFRGKTSSGIIVQFRLGEKIEERTISAKAAGVAEEFTPEIPVPRNLLFAEDISLRLERQPDIGQLHIYLEGGSFRIRSLVQVRIRYRSGGEDVFLGKNIAQAGVWSIPLEKANHIQTIEFSVLKER